MRLSTKGKYGVQAMFELAMHGSASPLSLKAIAERQGLSEHYLEQLAAPLRKAGLIQSIRGAQGGYQLARPANAITVGEILRVLEGPVEFAEPDPSRIDCPVQSVWNRVTEAMCNVLDKTTLADLVEEAQAKTAAEKLFFEI
jgi:Rrf2 family cysteine metabolism transcriptional repressor